ncbi:MAG: HDOD domain-containing protein [Gammaproteobacteria bacterium]|nr:HDOD domain-containing protein [Gammaproteobacteria bacterium]
MKIPEKIRSLLSQQDGMYRGVIESDAPESGRVVSQLVKCGNGFLLLITTLDARANLDKLSRMLKCQVIDASLAEVIHRLDQDDFESIAPIPTLYNIKAVIDPAVLKLDEPYLASGAKGLWIKSTKQDYTKLLRGHVKVAALSSGTEPLRKQILEQIEDLDKLPPMPGLAAQILRIKNNPYATSAELVSVVEQDPSLAAQLIRYANSAFYGVRTEVVDLERAVVQVLGFDFVLDLAFGLALGQSLQIERKGPLGLQAYWRHALATASVVQGLIDTMEYSSRPSSSMGYLSGLLHNIGLLLLGHLFPEQYELLNQTVSDNPDRNLLEIEQELLGVTHIELGEKLMKAWEMPSEIIDVAAHHHEQNYRSESGIRFANLVYVADQALHQYELNSQMAIDMPEALLEYVGISSDNLQAIVHDVMYDKDSIHEMARKMVA